MWREKMKVLKTYLKIFGAICIIALFVFSSFASTVNSRFIYSRQSLQADNSMVSIEIKQLGGGYENKTTVEVSQTEIEFLIEEIRKIQNSTLDAEKKMERELELLRNAGILPSTANLENLKKSAMNIRDILLGPYHFASKVPYTDKLNIKNDLSVGNGGMVYIGFGTAFALISPLDIITPVLFWPTPAPTLWRNSTHKDIPIPFLNMTIPFNATGRITWEYFDVLFGQSINNIGFLYSAVPIYPPYSESYPLFKFKGSFYAVLLLTVGLSLTIYISYDPPIILFDSIIGGCVESNFIIPSISWPG